MNGSYYGRPALKPPHWGWNVVSYLFLGGLMGGSAIVGALARERPLRLQAKTVAFALIAVNPPLLISHLGRPERFHHMLRIFKAKSPMSLGVWALGAFSAAAACSLACEAVRRRSGVLDALNVALGAFICGYTGVLLSATANPLWAKGKGHIPAACVASGIAGACALNLALLPHEASRSMVRALERLEIASAAMELAILLDFKRYGGKYAAPLFEGARGRKFRAVTLRGGILMPLLLNVAAIGAHRSGSRARRVAVAACTLAGGYVFRESLIEAGKTAAEDPRLGLVQPA